MKGRINSYGHVKDLLLENLAYSNRRLRIPGKRCLKFWEDEVKIYGMLKTLSVLKYIIGKYRMKSGFKGASCFNLAEYILYLAFESESETKLILRGEIEGGKRKMESSQLIQFNTLLIVPVMVTQSLP